MINQLIERKGHCKYCNQQALVVVLYWHNQSESHNSILNYSVLYWYWHPSLQLCHFPY